MLLVVLNGIKMKNLNRSRYKFKVYVLSTHCFAILAASLIAVFDQKICLSLKCEQLSENVMKFVNSSINPCEDFYEHACGKIESQQLQNFNRMMVESLIHQRDRVIKILDEPSFTIEPKSFTLGKKIFKLCQKVEDKVVEVGEVLKLIKQLGGFPTLENNRWDENSWSWLQTMIKIRSFGLFNEAIFAFTLGFDPQNLMNVVPYISVPTLTYIPHSLINCDRDCASYTNDFVNLTTNLGADPEKALLDAQEILSLEIELAKILLKFPSITEEYMLKNHLVTVSNLSSSYDFIDWRELIKAFLQVDRAPHMSFNVVIVNPEYIKTLKSIFKTTTKRILANYIMWSVLNRLSYRPGHKRNKKECFRFMEATLPILVQAMYLNKYPETDYEGLVSDMIKEIRKEMSRTIKNAVWLDTLTKNEAAQKVNNIYYRIGYPSEFLNTSFIDEYYKDLTLNGSMLNAILSIQKFYWDEYYSWLSHSFDKKSWTLISLFFKFIIYIPDANYIISDNSVNINHGMLQEPIFDKSWPSYINYGRIGSIIGHEISHSLDTSGVNYDKNGEAKKWWGHSFLDDFKNKALCFINQFNTYTVYNGTVYKGVNGDLTVGENIADSTGLELSLQVYRNNAKRLFWPELKLPGLHYSQEQMFYISFAQFYCSRQSYTNYAKSMFSVHAPNKFRVLGSIQNSEYFNHIFNCKSQSKMVPKSKCKLW